MNKYLEYASAAIAIPFMIMTFILGSIYGGLLAGWELAKENL